VLDVGLLARAIFVVKRGIWRTMPSKLLLGGKYNSITNIAKHFEKDYFEKGKQVG